MAFRRDLCPCGSGKRRASCCREQPRTPRAEAPSAVFKRYRDLLAEMHHHAVRTLGPRAMQKFAQSLPSHGMPQLERAFWFDLATFHLVLKDTTVAGNYLTQPRLDELDPALLATVLTPYSVHSVVEVLDSGVYRFRDLLLRSQELVLELDTEELPLKPGRAILGRVVAGERPWLLTRHPAALSAVSADNVVRDFLGKRRSVQAPTLRKHDNVFRLVDGWEDGLARESGANQRQTAAISSREVFHYPKERRSWLIAGLDRLPGLERRTPDIWTYTVKDQWLGTVVVEEDGELWIESRVAGGAERAGRELVHALGGLLTYSGREEGSGLSVLAPGGQILGDPDQVIPGLGLTLREALADPATRAELQAQLPPGISLDDMLPPS